MIRFALDLPNMAEPADLAGFDVAVVAPGVADRDAVAAYDAAGVTWLLVTGWLDDLPPLTSASPPE